MSKTLSQFRTAFVGSVVLLQLIVLPATRMLHLGCQHAQDVGRTATVSDIDEIDVPWKWCLSSHSCGHCSKHARVADDQPSDSSPAHPSHDQDSCPVCHAVFAACIATSIPVDLTSFEPICEFVAEHSQPVCGTPRYCVLSRGPPLAPLG